MEKPRIRSGSCPRQESSPPKPSRTMRRVISTTPLPIVLTLILLPALAFASPPDPSWVAGIFDGADSDDVVSLIHETCAASLATPSHLCPRPCPLKMSLDVRTVAGVRFTRGPRSPPFVCSPKFACLFTSLPPLPDTEAPVDHHVQALPLCSVMASCLPQFSESAHFPSEVVVDASRRSSHKRMPTLSRRETQTWRTS